MAAKFVNLVGRFIDFFSEQTIKQSVGHRIGRHRASVASLMKYILTLLTPLLTEMTFGFGSNLYFFKIGFTADVDGCCFTGDGAEFALRLGEDFVGEVNFDGAKETGG